MLPLVALIAGLLFFLASTNEDPVSRAQTPVVEPRLDPPEARQGDGASDETARGAGAGISGDEVEALRAELKGITQAYPGRYGVIVSDPSSGETISMDADGRFVAASINKLPVLMALYRSAAAGRVDLDDEISMQASDVQAYGTGSLYTKPVGHTLTLRECAGYLIKESDNTAWKMLDRYLGRDYIRSELYSAGARQTEYWIPNTTTPNDVLTMLERISDPSYTSPDLSEEMLDLMTNTDFEDRLPQPLPEDAKVSHKIGSYGTTFGDAGLVFPDGSRSPEDAYFIVVMVDETDEGTARAAMQEMSLATYRAFTTSDP
ncbi:MAG TPA: serine hydrolase [Rubrobacter sp.]|nr:serine hydrolase [Rubrobacter sp.]